MKNIVTFCTVYVILFQTFVVVPMDFCTDIHGRNICCFGYWLDPAQNKCIPCEKGYTGKNCHRKCQYPTYGKDCQILCDCNATYCHHANGCMQSTEYQNQSTTHLNNRTATNDWMAINSNISDECVSNVTSDNTTNINTPFCDKKTLQLKRIHTLIFGIIGLAALSFIIYLMYLYTRLLEKHQLNTSTV